MRQVGLILSLSLLSFTAITQNQKYALLVFQPVRFSAGEGQDPRLQRDGGRSAISAEERRVVTRYYDCVMTATRRLAQTAERTAAVALSALYSCPTARSDAQELLIRKYGFSYKQTLFKSLDRRLLRDAEALAARVRTSN